MRVPAHIFGTGKDATKAADIRALQALVREVLGNEPGADNLLPPLINRPYHSAGELASAMLDRL